MVQRQMENSAEGGDLLLQGIGGPFRWQAKGCGTVLKQLLPAVEHGRLDAELV